MYDNRDVLALKYPAMAGAGAAVLPTTSGDSIFRYAAIAAIVIGGTALVLQLAAIAYRHSSRNK